MKTLRACLAAGFLILGAAGSIRADDNLKHYQQALRDQGFYYGAINGSPGDETTQAIRRYQIRNGLAVSGQLNDETRRAIDDAANTAQSTPPPLVTPPAPTPMPVRRATANPTPPPDDQANANNSRPGPAPADAPPDSHNHIAPSAPLTNYFGGTPFEFAPPPVQSDAILRAQKLLTRTGFYDGPADGRPNHELADALSNYQEVSHLRRTGRLDTNTLAALRLLPERRRNAPGDDRRDAGQVYDGRIVH